MENYKEYIKSCIFDGKTSLGPTSYLDEDAKEALFNMIIHEQEKCLTFANNSDSDKIFKLITNASKIENEIKEYIEKACSDWVIKLFEIPQSTISVEMNLVQNVDVSDIRTKPEDIKITGDIDSERLLNEISKRRLLLSIISGCASILSSKINWLEIFSTVSSKLPKLYKEIIKLRFSKIYAPEKKYCLTGNSFSTVFITSGENQPEIRCDATCSPLLIEMTIKAIMELAISQGLPKSSEFSSIVVSKSDFSLADKWDLMIGIPLWKKICGIIKNTGYTIEGIGPNFFIMELSKMNYDDLFETINGILTNKSWAIKTVEKICNKIKSNKEQDDFNDFVKIANNKFPINDEYISSEELWTESFL